jgi:CDP-glycerol glycerophosphotransferase (TagB/SpsB family)
MLRFAAAHPQWDIVMRPHPIMFRTLVEQDLVVEQVLTEWLSAWNALPNTAIDQDGEIADAFAAADLFVTDGISFLGEYPIATGKPAIFFDKEDHWPWSPMGSLASVANIHVRDFDSFSKMFSTINRDGLPDFSYEIRQLRDAAMPHPGEAAKRIVDVVLEDYRSGTPLVDRSVITEIAWENRPGTEAPWPD